MKGLLVLLLSVGLTSSAATIPGGREAWCNLLKLPKLHYEWNLSWDFLDGFTQSTDTPDPAIEIPKLKARLQGRPVDAAIYWDIWRIHVRAEDEVQASNALTRVVALYRQWSEVDPENPAVLARFGLALSADDKDEEAGAVLRKAVRVAPKDWRGWSALAKWHVDQAWSAFDDTVMRKTGDPFPALVRKAAKREIPANIIEMAKKACMEAEQCADRAVALGTNEPMAYICRSATRSCADASGYVIRVSKGAEPDPRELKRALFSTNELMDLRRVAQLRPRDPLPLAAQVMVLAATGQAEGTPDGFDENTRRAIRDVLQKLEEISQATPPRTASFALEVRGNYLRMLEEDRSAEESVRRAVELDPARQSAWDLLITTQATLGRLKEAQATADRRLKQKETTRGRLYAAKVCDKLGLAEQAQAHANKALSLEPGGYLPNMTAAVLTLKHSKDAATAEKARPLLLQAKKMEGYTLSEEDAQEADMTAGIFCVLTGDLEEARKLFRDVLALYKDNETAKQALAMLAGK